MMDEDPSFRPKALDSEPDLWPHLAFYATAFTDLSADRPLGALGGCGSIPWTAIDAYGTRHGYRGDRFERLVRLVRAQDRVYVEHAAEKARAAGKR